MGIKDRLEKVKQFSLNLTAKILSIPAYWLGVSLSFFLWKLSNIFKKEKMQWLDPEEEEDYKSQY